MRTSLETYEGLKQFYDARFYCNTYTDMWRASDLQVDHTRTIRFYKKFYSIIEITYEYFGIASTGLTNPQEDIYINRRTPYFRSYAC